MRVRSILRYLTAAVLLGAAHPEAWACAACFGQSDSSMAQGMNMGIFSLLLVITTVLCGVAGFFVYLVRRSSQLAEQQEIAAHLARQRTNA